MTNKTYDRSELLAICEDAFVLQEDWSNRDTSGAQIQLGQCYALLKAGCEFVVIRGGSLATTDHTIWVEVEFNGFSYFDYGGSTDDETFYLPTRARLEQVAGKDWY